MGGCSVAVGRRVLIYDTDIIGLNIDGVYALKRSNLNQKQNNEPLPNIIR